LNKLHTPAKNGEHRTQNPPPRTAQKKIQARVNFGVEWKLAFSKKRSKNAFRLVELVAGNIELRISGKD
jgi:hypothetical protein